MSAKGIWFLPRLPGCAPDFTFTEGGRLQLGVVLESFNDPSSVLFFPATEEASPAIGWPPKETAGIERNHEHNNIQTRSAGGKILAKFLSIASASSEIETKRQSTLEFGKVDHKIVQFQYPLSTAAVQAILKQASIKKLNSGLWRWFLPKPIYVVSGLRIATESFTVTQENNLNFHEGAIFEVLNSDSANTEAANGAAEDTVNAAAGAAASGVAAAAATHIPVGGELSGHVDDENKTTHAYETIGSKGVVFAYSMHVIRQRANMFADSSAFMTGDGDVEDVECVEVTNTVEGLEDMKQESIEELDAGIFVYC